MLTSKGKRVVGIAAVVLIWLAVHVCKMLYEAYDPFYLDARRGPRIVRMVQHGDLAEVRKLVDADPSLANLRREEGHLPLLSFAAINGQLAVASYLLDKGADVNALNAYGSALHGAAEGGHIDMVGELLRRGADPRSRSDWGMTPLHRTGRSVQVAEMLVSAGAEIDARDKQGRTPLHRCKNVDMARFLIERHADVNAVDESGYTPLHWFATPREIFDPQTAQYLLDNGADTQIRDREGLTPRQLAEKNEQTEFLQFLDAQPH